eukprot:GHVN01080389.1.p2 GENE.GHVN01080389.1~~GHVN01080389.1.p2  ORF type:complete len:116 (+),score=2.31 GHVN01080389.1:484-831(+)
MAQMTCCSHFVALVPSCTTFSVKLCFNASINDNLRACAVLGTWLWSSIHLGCAGDGVLAHAQHAMKMHTGCFFAGSLTPCTFCWVHICHGDGKQAFGVSMLLVWFGVLCTELTSD